MRFVIAFLIFAALAFVQLVSEGGLLVKLLFAHVGLVYLATALAYSQGWHGLFGKRRSGALPLTSYLLFWPYILPQQLLYEVYARLSRENPIDEICPGVFIGRRPSARRRAFLVEHGIEAVLDVTAAFPAPALALRARLFLCLPILDGTGPSPELLGCAVTFLRDAETEKSAFLVHCAAGHGRSALIVAAFLLDTGRASTAVEAVAMIKKSRPSIHLKPAQMKALELFGAARGESRH